MRPPIARSMKHKRQAHCSANRWRLRRAIRLHSVGRAGDGARLSTVDCRQPAEICACFFLHQDESETATQTQCLFFFGARSLTIGTNGVHIQCYIETDRWRVWEKEREKPNDYHYHEQYEIAVNLPQSKQINHHFNRRPPSAHLHNLYVNPWWWLLLFSFSNFNLTHSLTVCDLILLWWPTHPSWCLFIYAY